MGIRNVTGVPAVTNPNDPFTVPVYSAQFSDSQCTDKIMDYPDSAIYANSCDSAGEAGLYVFIDYKPNDINQPPLNIALPNRVANPIVAFEGVLQNSCLAQDLTQALKYFSYPYSACEQSIGSSTYNKFSCSSSSAGDSVKLTINTYADSTCTSSPSPQSFDIDFCSNDENMWVTCPGPTADDDDYNSIPSPQPSSPSTSPPTSPPTTSGGSGGGGNNGGSGDNTISITTGGGSNSDSASNRGMLTALIVIAVMQFALTIVIYMKGNNTPAPIFMTTGNNPMVSGTNPMIAGTNPMVHNNNSL